MRRERETHEARVVHFTHKENQFLVSALPYIPLMTIRPRRSIKLLVCHSCGQTGTLREIVYGMPDPEHFDFEKYAVGGCCISGDGTDPDVRCRECDWEGFRKDF